MTKSKAYADIS